MVGEGWGWEVVALVQVRETLSLRGGRNEFEKYIGGKIGSFCLLRERE